MSTLSNANSVLLLKIERLYPVPLPIQGYSVDDAFTVPDVTSGETMMGVDGHLSAGYTPYEVPLEITLMADSASNIIMDQWIGAEQISKDKYVADVTLLIQGTGALYTFTRGFLKSFTPLPAGRKVLQPRKFTLGFESMTVGPA